MDQPFVDKLNAIHEKIKITREGPELDELIKERDELQKTCDHSYPNGDTANWGTPVSHTCRICGLVD